MATPLPQSAKAFTLTFPSVVEEIVTDAGITRPFLASEAPSEVIPMKALWDTGATHCCITQQAAERANLPVIGRAMLVGVHGQKECNEYFLNLTIPNQVMVSGVQAVECEDVEGSFDVIIGMNVITLGDFAISQQVGKSIFTFRIPSLGAIDFVEQG